MKRQVVFFTDINTRQDTHLGRKGPKHPAVSEWWLRRRYRIWQRTAWKSIQKQTREDWLYVVRCHPNAKPITDRIWGQVKDQRMIISYIYSDQEVETIRCLAAQGKEIVMVRLDSDDMYHPSIAEEVMCEPRNYLWFYWKRGYALDIRKNWLYRWTVRRCGPFFAHRYPDPSVFATKKNLSEPDHSTIWAKAPAIMAEGRFVVGITGQNTTSGVRNCVGRVPPSTAKNILSEFL